MIAAWMLSASAIGALLLLAALAGDAAFARLGWPRRWLWATTMVAMCVVPLVPHAVPLLPDVAFVSFGRQPIAPAAATITPLAGEPGAPNDPAAPAIGSVAPPVLLGETLPITTDAPRDLWPTRVASTSARGPQFFITASSPLARADTPLLAVWAGLSLTVVLLIGLAMQRLRRERGSWVPADGATHRAVRVIARDAVPVWRSTHLGPAAFGLGAMHVVLPRWIDELDADERALLIAHEAEHVRVHDPRLIAAALLMVAALPWHLPLAVAYRRLCRAVEHDCDARVLAVHADVRSYGRLLVRTAEWLLEGRRTWRGTGVTRWILAPVPAFAAPASELEARLRALGRRRRSWQTRLGALGGGIGALVAITMACAVPMPTRASVTLVGPGSIEAAVADPVAAMPRARATSATGTAQPSAGLPAWFGTVVGMLTRDSITRHDEFDRALEAGLRANLRRLVPEVLDPLRTGDAYVWLVFGPTGDAIAHGVGPEGMGARPVGAATTAGPRRATATTPEDERTLDATAWRTRFPMLSRDPATMGWYAMRVGVRTVNVMWALTALPDRAGDDRTALLPRPALDAGVADGIGTVTAVRPMVDLFPATMTDAERAIRFTEIRDAADRTGGTDDRLATLLRAAIATARPELLRGRRGDGDFVWLVLDPAARVVAADTGRAGLGRTTDGWFAELWAPRARSSTPRDSLMLDDLAFRRKFGWRVPLGRQRIWQAIALPNGTINVLWTVAARD